MTIPFAIQRSVIVGIIELDKANRTDAMLEPVVEDDFSQWICHEVIDGNEVKAEGATPIKAVRNFLKKV